MLEVDILPRDEDHAHSSLVEPSEGEQDLHMSLVLARKRSRPDLAYKNAAQRADAIQWHGSRASSRSRQSPKSSSRSLQSSMASMAPSVSRGRSSRYPRGKYEITPRNLALVRYRPRIGQTSAGHESLNPPGINAKAARSSVSDVTEMDAKVVLPRQAKTSLRGILINDQTRIQASRPKSPSLVYIRAADLGSADDIVEPMRSTVLNAPSSSAEKHIPTPKGAMHTGVDASDVEHDISTEQSDPSTVGPIENRIWEIASDGHIELLGAEPRRPPLILVDGLPQHAKRSHSEPRPTKEYEDVTYGTGPVRAGGILKTGTKVDRRSNVKKQDSGRVRFDTHTVLYTQDMSPDHEKATFEMGEPSDLRASRLAELPSNSSDWTANWVMNVASVPKSYTSSDPQTGVLDTSSTMFEEPDELQPEDQATTQVNGAIKSMDPTGSNPVQSSTSTSPVVRPKTIPLPAHVSDDDSDEARIYTENLGSEPILFEIPTTASTYGPTVATSKDQESFASESSIERRGRTSRTNPLRHGVRELYSSPSIASSSISDGEYEGLSSNESTTTRSGVLSRRRPNRRAIGSFSSDEDDRDHVHLSRRRQRQSRPIMSSSQASGSSKRSQSFHSEEERPRYDTDRTQHDRDRPRRRLSRVPEPPGVTIYNDSDDELPRGRRRRNSPRPGPTDWDDGATYHGADLSDRYSNTGPSYIDRTRRTHTDSRRPVNTFISDYNPFISDPTDYKHPDGHTFHNEYWYRSPSKRHYGSLYQDNYPYYDDDVYSLPHRSRYRSRSPDSPPYSSYGDHRVAAPYVHSQSRSRAARPNIANHRLPRAPTPPGYEERSYVSASQGPRIRNSAAYTRRSYKDDVRSELETVEGDLARLQEDQYLRSNSKSGPSSLAETQALEDDITELRLQLARLQPKSADPSWLEETEVATPTLPSLRERTGGHQNAESESVHVKVPPFFTWATYPGDVADPNDESAEAAILRKFDSLEYVLKGVRERLCANGRGAKIFNDVQLMSLEQFEDSHTDLLVQGSETSLDAPNGDQQPNETSNISPMILDDDAASSKIQNNITGNQSAKRALLKKDLLHITKDLFSLFVPLSHIHEVMSRYWGLLSNFCSILDVKEPAQSAREVWIVCFIENETEILGKFGLNAPSPALSECSDCANGRIYANERSGLRHLWYQHFVPTAGAQTAMLPPDALRNWLRSEEQLRIELSTIAISKILQVFLEHGRRFYARAKAIRNGVADSDKTKSAKSTNM
ncbi:hypothetical protein EJ05DRAFT_38601 [Pseudovirgaria hyperparasitica]|uniref:Uncharacterized protein n=1 Tax=Pseudovirgaria hyperparasitica TaxID=470096 RepID=A0A6A6WMK2_9PEZI|nr:uncharacterized protein EJ05DRAFT_38601 [Pseudovirgaria hyperparasitica]KAF2763434.1 hypothetical protein EJ05DRAFT_38601 [Pseudovirgaria hyperparasitica]